MRTDHGHAHYLPTAEGGGRRWITHVTIYAANGSGPVEVAALTGLRELQVPTAAAHAAASRLVDRLVGRLRAGREGAHAAASHPVERPALRRLRFLAKSGEHSTPEGDLAARTYLAALGLLGATLAVEAGYDLRSRCLLRAKDAVCWELLGKPGDADKPFAHDKAAAIKLYNDALTAVQKARLPIELDEITLKPSDDLVTLVRKSMELAAAEAGEGE
jgi:hypothetical protein